MSGNLLIHKDFLRILPSELTTRLEELARIRRFRDGEVIFRRGDEGRSLFGIQGGRVQVLGHGADGREFVLTVLGEGEWFGELSFFDGLARTHDNVAIGDVTLSCVDEREVRALLSAQPEFWAPFAELMSHRIRMLFALLEDATLLDLPTRLAKRILELAGDHGRSDEDGGTTIDVHLPQEDLAAMLGVTREAAGRHLKRFEREGWIELAYGRLRIRSRSGLVSLLDR